MKIGSSYMFVTGIFINASGSKYNAVHAQDFTGEHCRNLNSDMTYYCPVARYCEWDFYSAENQAFLENDLTYSTSSWNYAIPNSAVEEKSFSSLSASYQAALSTLGYNEDTHDCCNGHYTDYAWSDFDRNDGYAEILDSLVVLGYDQETWDNSLATQYDNTFWADLPAVAREAAEWLCQSEEIWNELDLSAWPEDKADLMYPGEYATEDCRGGGGRLISFLRNSVSSVVSANSGE